MSITSAITSGITQALVNGVTGSIVVSGPTFNAAVFDGTNDYMSLLAAPNSTMPSSFEGTFVCYVKRSGTAAATIFRLESSATSTAVVVRWAPTTANLVLSVVDITAGTTVSIVPGLPIANDGKYHRLWFAWQDDGFGLSTNGELKIDGATIGSSSLAAGPVDYSVCDRLTIGATQAGANRINGAIGLLGFYTTYIADDSFGNPDNTPKTISADGEIDSVRPMIWLPSGGNTFKENTAPGGVNLTVTGSLVDEVINV